LAGELSCPGLHWCSLTVCCWATIQFRSSTLLSSPPPLQSARRLCNRRIVSHVQQVICFAFHDSRLLLETCSNAKDLRKIVTMFYLD